MIAPTGSALASISIFKGSESGIDLIVLISESTLHVAVDKVADPSVVLIKDVCLRSTEKFYISSIFFLERLNRHYGHEVISGIAELRTFEVDTGEIINGLLGFIEINNLSL